MKIVLAELDKNLFPERYHYFNDHFTTIRSYLKNYDQLDETAELNISFIVRVTKLCYNIKSNEMRIAIRYLYDKLIDNSFNWQTNFDWKEIKVILLFFVLFSDSKNLLELETRIKNPITKMLMQKYQPIITQ